MYNRGKFLIFVRLLANLFLTVERSHASSLTRYIIGELFEKIKLLRPFASALASPRFWLARPIFLR